LQTRRPILERQAERGQRARRDDEARGEITGGSMVMRHLANEDVQALGALNLEEVATAFSVPLPPPPGSTARLSAPGARTVTPRRTMEQGYLQLVAVLIGVI
jgi:hypothetical protein